MRPFTNMHIMKKYILIFLCLITVSGSFAQMQDFKFKFYGQIRTDFYYNSRANEETVDGLFYMYPKDKVRDPEGNDLNSTPNSNFYTLYSRLGVDVAGPKLGTAKTSAKVEVDFRGTGTSYSVIRLRHAYLNLDWGKSALLLGQNWHPLFGDVSPQILNLSVGAPFQPFSRAPQIRYRYTNKNFQLTGAAVWQSQYTSQGPEGKTHKYLKQSCIPEFYVGADYKNGGLLAGVGIELLSLKPRTESIVNTDKYKVDERITTLSYEAHVKYTKRLVHRCEECIRIQSDTSFRFGWIRDQVCQRTNGRTRIYSDTFLQLLVQRCLRTEMEAGNLRRLCQESGNK